MIVYTPTILGQLQKYALILKEQVMENFSIQYRGGIIWNSLPNDLKELKSSNAFKKALHTHVHQRKILFDTLINMQSDTHYATFLIFNYVKKSFGNL